MRCIADMRSPAHIRTELDESAEHRRTRTLPSHRGKRVLHIKKVAHCAAFVIRGGDQHSRFEQRLVGTQDFKVLAKLPVFPNTVALAVLWSERTQPKGRLGGAEVC